MALNFKKFWESSSIDDSVFLIEGTRKLSYRQVFSKSDTLFGGLERGTVAIFCQKNVATIMAYMGCLRNGLIPLLVDASLKIAAVDRILSAYQPRYLFGPKSITRKHYSQIEIFDEYALFEKRSKSNQVISEELALLLGTSGSTGDPKFVRLSYQSLSSCTHSINEYLGMDTSRRCISLLPFQYSYGLSVLNCVAASRGSMVVTSVSVLDSQLWKIIPELRVTDISAVPFMFEIIQRLDFEPDVLESLRCVTQAGGRLDPRVTERMIRKFKPHGIKYFTMYGQTEASPRIAYLPCDKALEKLGSVGVPISCGSAYIEETGRPFGVGELVYRGPNVALGYAESARDLALGDEFNGELKTGDQVRIDEEGYIYIIGRRKRNVKLQGVSVNLDHVESVLNGNGINCVVTGEENTLLICHLEHNELDIRAVVQKNFSIHTSNIRMQLLDSIPYNANGKPDYLLLQNKFLS